MPRFKRIDADVQATCSNVAEMMPALFRDELGDKKMASKIEAIGQKYNFGWVPETKATISGALDSQGSETETGKVAVAICDARARHQQAVDGGHQPTEQGAGRCEADGSSLGHWCPLCWRPATCRLIIWEQFMYTRCQRQRICLHSSNRASATQHKWVRLTSQMAKKAGRSPPAITSPYRMRHSRLYYSSFLSYNMSYRKDRSSS